MIAVASLTRSFSNTNLGASPLEYVCSHMPGKTRKKLIKVVTFILTLTYQLIIITTIILPANLITNASVFSSQDVSSDLRPIGISYRKIYLSEHLRLKQKLPVVIHVKPLNVGLRYIRPGDHTFTNFGSVRLPGFKVDAVRHHPVLKITPICFTYTEPFNDLVKGVVLTADQYVIGINGAAEALVSSSVRQVPVSFMVESIAVLHGFHMGKAFGYAKQALLTPFGEEEGADETALPDEPAPER